MSHGLRFQVLVIPNVPWPEYLDRFLRLEDLGFDVAAAPDHFCDWSNPTGPWLEAWTCLAAIAARTSTIRLTTCVTQIPLRNPAVLAHQAVTVDQISGGRLELGLGTGLTIDPSYDMIGVPNWTNRERVERFGEYLELVDKLLVEGVTTYHGDHYNANGAVMNPGSVQQPRLPIMVAALGPQMMRRAVQHADIWNCLSFAKDFGEQLAELSDRCMSIDELCAEFGRDPATLRRSYTMFDASARAEGGAINYYESDELFVDMVHQVIELGITEVSLYYPAVASQLPAFERIATEVLPVLRREMRSPLLDDLQARCAGLVGEGLFKSERVISSPQSAHIQLADGSSVLNLCANNYLGLADNPDVIAAAHRALDTYGYGMASVRFICGTLTVHKELEARLSAFLGTDDTILYSSCFDANGGLFETILDEQDAVISDALNHASIIDGIRLCRARRLRYDNNDMSQLEQRLQEAADARYRLIATDGVFSMDGVFANLPVICDLAERYDALVMVDDSHAVGLVGEHGRGTHEFTDVMGRVDIITGTLGKALGGASGGYTSGRREVIEWLRQRSRPYLFSNSLAPVVAAASVGVLDLLEAGDGLRERMRRNATRFRSAMADAGFTLVGAGHPIIPVMLGDARVASEIADRLLAEGVYVIAFSFPVVPQGKARIRTQMSAAHSDSDVDQAIDAFVSVGRAMGVVP